MWCPPFLRATVVPGTQPVRGRRAECGTMVSEKSPRCSWSLLMSMPFIPAAEREALVRLGDEIFERDIAPLVAAEDGKSFVVIDVTSGAYEVDSNERVASDRLYARKPEALVYVRRVGSRFARHFGGRPLARS